MALAILPEVKDTNRSESKTASVRGTLLQERMQQDSVFHLDCFPTKTTFIFGNQITNSSVEKVNPDAQSFLHENQAETDGGEWKTQKSRRRLRSEWKKRATTQQNSDQPHCSTTGGLTPNFEESRKQSQEKRGFVLQIQQNAIADFKRPESPLCPKGDNRPEDKKHARDGGFKTSGEIQMSSFSHVGQESSKVSIKWEAQKTTELDSLGESGVPEEQNRETDGAALYEEMGVKLRPNAKLEHKRLRQAGRKNTCKSKDTRRSNENHKAKRIPEKKGPTGKAHLCSSMQKDKIKAWWLTAKKTLLLFLDLGFVLLLLLFLEAAVSLLQVDASSGVPNLPSRDRYRTNCNIYPSTIAYEGEASCITCYFPDDIRQSKFKFDVVKYDIDESNPSADMILNCIWNKTDPHCTVKAGYKLNQGTIGTNVTIDIAMTEKEHSGRYACRYELSSTRDHNICTMEVQAPEISCAVSPSKVLIGAPAFVSCRFHTDLTSTRTKFHVYRFSSTIPEEIAYCTWETHGNSGTPWCTVASGYKLNKANITTIVSLEIASVEDLHAGNYSCRTIPFNRKATISDCTMHVEEAYLVDTETQLAKCETGGAVFEGDPSFVSCLFHEDFRRHRHPFHLLRYDFEGLDTVPDLILTCLWDGGAKIPKCVAKDGYHLTDSMVGNVVRLKIAHTSRKNAGKFVCMGSTSQTKDQQVCTLDIKGRHISCKLTKPVTVVGTSTNVTCNFNSNIGRTKEDFYIQRFQFDSSEPVTVVDCAWGKGGIGETPDCEVAPGYQLDQLVGSTLSVHIENVDQSHAGRYTCNVLPYNVTSQGCTLSLQDEVGATSQSTGPTSVTKLRTLLDSTTSPKTPRKSEWRTPPVTATGGDTSRAAKGTGPDCRLAFICLLASYYMMTLPKLDFLAVFHSTFLAPCRGGMA